MEPEQIKKIAIISVISVFVIGLVVYLIFHTSETKQVYKVDLEIWGVFDDSDVFLKQIQEFKKRNPYVGDIKYKKVPIDSYESDLLDAMATGKGPDIFLIHNSWLQKHQEKLSPAPDSLVDGKPVSVVSAKQVRDVFPDVVTQDFVRDSEVYALPLSVDSLALYVNKDYLNQAGIARVPQTWLEFDEAVKKMTKIDASGIQISGAAIGASSDAGAGEGKINRATDILMLLMMQSGAEMVDEKGLAAFANFVQTSPGKSYSPGQMALDYYTKFSNRNFSEYCWNSLQHNSIDSFIEGKTAMILNYSWLLPKIELKAPKLNFGVASVPQNKDQQGKGLNVNFANYWGFAVSRNKITDGGVDGTKTTLSSTNDQRIYEAWRFLRYLTMNPVYSQDLPKSAAVGSESAKFDPAEEYILKQKKPAARRDLIETQKNDPILASFAEGNLIARSWPQFDNLAVEKIFDDMIDDVALRNENSLDAINQAQNSVNLLMKK